MKPKTYNTRFYNLLCVAGYMFCGLFFFSVYLLILLSSYSSISLSSIASAASQIASNFNVSGSVHSPVDKEKSKMEISAKETLADPSSHSILLTFRLVDSEGNPISDRQVEVYSNRGQVDIIEAVSKLSQYKAQASNISDLQKDNTNQDGIANFRISSFIPGEAVISAIADNVVNLGSVKFTFLPPPFPANITISVGLPGQKEWVLLSPPEQNLSPTQKAAKRLVNSGTKVKIPFWVFVSLSLWFLFTPVALLVMIGFFAKIRKVEKEEFALLKTVAEARDLNSLQDGLKDHRLISNRGG